MSIIKCCICPKISFFNKTSSKEKEKEIEQIPLLAPPRLEYSTPTITTHHIELYTPAIFSIGMSISSDTSCFKKNPKPDFKEEISKQKDGKDFDQVLLIDQDEVLTGFKSISRYSDLLQNPFLFIQKFIKKFSLLKFEGSGGDKATFRDQQNNIVKITFADKNDRDRNLKFIMKEIEFLIANPDIANAPKNIVIYLTPSVREDFLLKYQDFIETHLITIEEINNEFNIEGIVIWKEEAYVLKASEAFTMSDSPEKIKNIKSIVNFWNKIIMNISKGKEYMVEDIHEGNIGIFQDGSSKIFDARPSDTPFKSAEWFKKIIFQRYNID